MNSPRYQTAKSSFVATITVILTTNAVSVMLFGGLGKTVTNAGWNYVLTLYIFLGAIGITHFLSTLERIKTNFFYLVSTLLSGALLGFYYGGAAANNNPQIATISAIALSIVFSIGFWLKYQFLPAIVAIISSIAAYGFAFFSGTQALSLFSVDKIISGVIWGLFCSIYLFLAIENFLVSINFNNK